MPKNYAYIILPLALAADYSYEIPDHLLNEVAIGKRVEVQFGAKRVYAGIVKKIYQSEPPTYKVKSIINVLDEHPIVNDKQFQLWQWISTYYMCTEGEVMQTAIPSGFKLSSETKLILNPSFSHDFSMLDDQEFILAEALIVQKELTIDEVQSVLQRKKVFFVVKSLIEKGVLIVKEKLIERYKPKTSAFVSLHKKYQSEVFMQQLFSDLSRATKQLQLLMTFVQLTTTQKLTEIDKTTLLKKANTTTNQLNALIKKGVFTIQNKSVSRLNDAYTEEVIDYELTPHQLYALNNIRTAFDTKNVVLLHGITSSGKTQLYMKLITEAIAQGNQVLYLLPEIALTAQIIARLRKVFGNDIGIYHSKFNHNERIEIWHKVLNGTYKVVVGARSALFLPFTQLQLVIIDEEHDHSFKQFDPAPRYHARDAAIYLAHLHKAKTVIGSATPAIESYFNATKGNKYALVKLTERYGGVQPPAIEVIDMKEAARNKKVKSHFSNVLLNNIKTALDQGEQAIIFQNRRGYAPYFICVDCETIPQCHQCDVSLTYHKYSNELKCHYCGYKRRLMAKCDSCASTNLQIKGFGTEKIEDELQLFFPNSKIGRLDLEVARTKKGFENVIAQFEKGEIQILVGTQMITKGLDFDNVRVVGIVSADQLLNFPDFRAAERAFQMMLQVSGRAGRRQKQGKVLIQSNSNKYAVLMHVINQNYRAFYLQEIQERLQFNYPPFSRMLRISLKHKDKKVVNEAAFVLTKMLIEQLKKQVLGPTVPMVSKVRLYYLRHVVVKMNKSKAPSTKVFIADTITALKTTKKFKQLIVQIDVDPY